MRMVIRVYRIIHMHYNTTRSLSGSWVNKPGRGRGARLRQSFTRGQCKQENQESFSQEDSGLKEAKSTTRGPSEGTGPPRSWSHGSAQQLSEQVPALPSHSWGNEGLPGVPSSAALAPAKVRRPPSLRCLVARWLEMVDVHMLCFHIRSQFLKRAGRENNRPTQHRQGTH